MDEDLKNKIIASIEKSGFPLQTYASIVLNKKGWSVKSSPTYFDEGIKKYREIDIVAQKNCVNTQNSKNILIIECKKSSSKPWVFFKQTNVPINVLTMNIAAHGSGEQYDLFEKQFKEHFYSKEPVCTYYLVPFSSEEKKNTNKENEIFGAVEQVMSALRFYTVREDEHMNKNQLKGMEFVYPIIVFDGLLCSAHIENEKINIKEEDRIALHIIEELDKAIELWGANTVTSVISKPFIINVVKKEYFEKFLENFDTT